MNNNNEWQWGEPEKTQDSMQDASLDQNCILGKRYLCCGMDAEMRSFDKGDWVSYADYARLKAEVERLKNNYDYLDQKLDEELAKRGRHS